MGETDLCYAPEVFNEINRDENMERMRETSIYVTGAFTQAVVDAERMKEIATELKEVLPGTSSNTKSDRKQVASCIVAEIPYSVVKIIYQETKSLRHPEKEKVNTKNSMFTSVPREGLEPSRPCEQQILSLPCLPFHHQGFRFLNVGL